jgi:hypothetical protein
LELLHAIVGVIMFSLYMNCVFYEDDINRPLKLYYDNNPTVQYAHNNRSSDVVKYIDIKFYVKDKVRDHIISLEHISTEKMLADPLTKGLPPNVFREHIAGMGLRENL